MKKSIRVVYREPNGFPEVRTVEDQTKLDGFRNLLHGGYLEAVPFGKKLAQFSLYCDEEGKLKGLAPNLSYPSDVVVGPIFVAGTIDSQGYHNDLSDEDIRVIESEIHTHSIFYVGVE